jgi:hypothetical protein
MSLLAAWRGVRQVEYPAGQVSPLALVSALTRAGVGADTLNSVVGKLLVVPYLQGGVSLDALISSSLLRDRDMRGGAVKPTIIVAVKKALGVRKLLLRSPSRVRRTHSQGGRGGASPAPTPPLPR